MAYGRVPTDDEVMWNEETAEPLLTLADEHGGRAQIINDDHCYVLLIRDGERYKTTSWWFKEAVAASRDLPLPE